jgi:hypothetical protein
VNRDKWSDTQYGKPQNKESQNAVEDHSSSLEQVEDRISEH